MHEDHGAKGKKAGSGSGHIAGSTPAPAFPSRTFCGNLRYYTMAHLTLKSNTLRDAIRLNRGCLLSNLLWTSVVSGTGREIMRVLPEGNLFSTLTVRYQV